ncbi:MAG: amidohydrolase, partial [Pacificimonas sp.]
MTFGIRTLFAAALTLVAMPVLAQSFAITNASVIDGTGAAERPGTTIVVRDGRIASLGTSAAPGGMQVYDAGGRPVTPGLVAAWSQLGIVEVGAVRQTNETRASDSPYSAALDIAPAVNPRSASMAIARLEGVTRAGAVPVASSDLFGGQGAVVSTAFGAGVMRARAFQYIQFGEGGARIAGGSRAATAARLADVFDEVADYAR